MDIADEERLALRLLDAIESGVGFDPADAAIDGEDIDPVFVYVLVTFLRRNYPATNPAARGVLERVTGMLGKSRSLAARYDEGKRDPISQWFDKEHDYAAYRGRGRELLRADRRQAR